MVVVLLLLGIIHSVSSSCSSDSFSVTSYTTTNLPLATETALVVEFTHDCLDSKLFAVIGRSILIYKKIN